MLEKYLISFTFHIFQKKYSLQILFYKSSGCIIFIKNTCLQMLTIWMLQIQIKVSETDLLPYGHM